MFIERCLLRGVCDVFIAMCLLRCVIEMCLVLVLDERSLRCVY